MVVVEDASEPFAAGDRAVFAGPLARFLDEVVPQTLVIALCVVVLRELSNRFPKVAFAQRDDLGQALGLDGANESLRVRVQVGAACWKLHCLQALVHESQA